MNQNEGHLFPIDDEGRCGIAESRDAIIDRFLLNEMTEQEKEGFLDHILLCSVCNRELRFRESIVESLRKEPVSESIEQRAREILERRSGNLPFRESGSGSSITLWLKIAAVFVGIFMVSSLWYYLTAPAPSPWGQVATIDPSSGYHPQHIHDEDNSPWQAYNEGMSLLFRAQKKNWLRPGVHFDQTLVKQAIEILRDSYPMISPEARKMDVAYYLCKANLMLNNPTGALEWLEKTKEIGTNKLKMERAIQLCEQVEKAVDSELQKKKREEEIRQLKVWQTRAKNLRLSLKALISQ